MKTYPCSLLFPVLAMLLATTWAHALDTSATPACHALMTEAECASYLATLARLPMGEERARYVAAHHELMREREFACDCGRYLAGPDRTRAQGTALRRRL